MILINDRLSFKKNDHGLLIYGDTCQNAVYRYFYSFFHESSKKYVNCNSKVDV